jgi:ectoine hydroxylase-related dioxygenase (phytanoyl-CoA dioxygenase family)
MFMPGEIFRTDRLQELKQSYEKSGYAFPIQVLPNEEISAIRDRIETYLATSGRNSKEDPYLQYKVHFVFPWADRLVRHPAILDAVETLIGANILVWNTALLIKEPRTSDFVSWHQDVYYWGNKPEQVVGAWLAISDSTPENGCVRIIPGSHRGGILHHRDTFGTDNMLSRGQQIDQPPGQDNAVDMILQPGEMSLHHTHAVHSSHPNQSDRSRIGFVITYMVPATKMIGPRTGATLVRGKDGFNHFDLESVRPKRDLDPHGLAAHTKAMKTFAKAIYEGAAQEGRVPQV